MNAALVMRDRETDSWWSIMTGDAMGGPMEGTPLTELPTGRKMTWGEWKALYPHTKILSVNGREHDVFDPYERYFSAAEGFRGTSTPDGRLPDKEAVFVFKLDSLPYAVSHSTIEGGKVFEIGGREVFLYRSPGDPVYASTAAYISSVTGGSRFVEESGRWKDRATGIFFSRRTEFASENRTADTAPEALGGFDTFWYIWSSTHENVYLLD